MSETLHNQISAFMDGELPEHEAELLVRRLCASEELRGVAARYSLIGDVMRGERIRSDGSLADRVMASVNSEPEVQESKATGLGRWTRPLAGLAVAATVAGVAIVGLQTFETQPASTPEVMSVDNGNPQVVAPFEGSNSEQLSSSLRRRLNVYQVSHNLYRQGHRQWGALVDLQGAEADTKALESEEEKSNDATKDGTE